jgi:thiamine biosynthesis lipoprotein
MTTSRIAHGALQSVGAGVHAIHRAQIEAMGNDVDILFVGGTQRDLETACARVAQLHSRWTRFESTSELMTINNNPGQSIRVSKDTVELAQCMLAGFTMTNGLFDATVLSELVKRGFGRAQSDSQLTTTWTAPALGDALERTMVVDANQSIVAVPSGVGIDAGGIGKGLAADILVREALQAGVAGACVTIGGEVRVAGTPPRGSHWRVGVTDPDSDDNLDVLAIRDGGAATSNADGWRANGYSHIVDPRDCERSPALLQATAVCGQAWQAEVVAKALLLQDPQSAIDFAEDIGCEALVVTRDLETYETSGWESLCI